MRIQAGIWTAVLALLVTVTPITASAAPGENQGRGAENRSERADAALEAAQALFRPQAKGKASADPHARRTTDEPHTEHATLVLRDLVLGYDDLEPADQQVARRILARPTDGDNDYWRNGYPTNAPTAHTCSESAEICLHWVNNAAFADAPDLTDTSGSGVPDWVEENQRVFEEVWQRIIGDLGYKAPKSDAGPPRQGPDGRTDIYLSELSGYGMYGYCTIDNPRERALYCVIDNDFAERMYGNSKKALRVTAAHEFFHAIQFGYSIRADSWVMEGTAAWIEDEVYDHINDNLQFLSHSDLSCPDVPLDFIGRSNPCRPQTSYAWLYGSWIWWQFLTERYGKGKTADPTVVREIWERIGRGAGTVPAQRRTIAARGGDYGRVFADFAAVNRIAGKWYDEGRSYARFVGRPAGRFALTRKRPDLGWKSTRLNHLSSRHAVLVPGKGLRGKWRLRVNLDLPPKFRGSQATAIVHRKDGRVRLVRARLNKQGDGRLAVPFNKREIARVTLALTNASTRYKDCTRNPERATGWTCGGKPLDDGLVYSFRARAVR
jgi:hypothetical protein